MTMSKALESALLAVARMKGDSDVAEADLRQMLATALRILVDGDDGNTDDETDQDERPH